MHDPEPGVDRRVLGHYSPIRVIAAVIATVACALVLAIAVAGLLFPHATGEPLAAVVLILFTAPWVWVGAPACLRALRQLFTARGAAIWLAGGKLVWDGGRTSMPLDAMKSAQPALGRAAWNDITIEVLDGRPRYIQAALIAEPRDEIRLRIALALSQDRSDVRVG